MVPGDVNARAVADAVAEGLLVYGYTDEGALDAGEVETLILEVTAFLVYAGECAIRRNACDVGFGVEEDLVDGLGAISA